MERLSALQAYLAEKGKDGLCVAFSGGVDSSLVLKAAVLALGNRVSAVTFSSRLSPKEEPEEAKKLAESFGVRHYALRFEEPEDDPVRNNPPDRCYYCKKRLFGSLIAFCRENGLGTVADGTNADDLTQYRPGLRALRELGVLSPLAECGFTKTQVRQAAGLLNIPVSGKPSAPCLATRFPYGVRLTDKLLERAGKSEEILKLLGFPVCRVRIYDTLARVELPPRDFSRFLSLGKEIADAFKALGFLYITLDVEGFRSGSMDLVLKEGENRGY